MPKATAVWLVENTALTFDQIADFCGMHLLEVKGIANGDVAAGVIGLNPVLSGQLTEDEIKRCEADEATRLEMMKRDLPEVKIRSKGPRYTPMNKRTEKPDAIAWLIKTFPGLSDAAIGRLLATTKDTIKSVRERTHWNIANIKPQNPVLLGLITQRDLDGEVAKIRKSQQVKVESEADDFMPAEGEEGADGATPNPFAAALAAYASAAQKKVQAEPTIESVFGTNTPSTDDEE
jgi:hypothetical protein